MSDRRGRIILLVVLLGLAVIALVVLQLGFARSSIEQIVALLTGMLVMASALLLQGLLVETQRVAQQIEISFDERLISQMLEAYRQKKPLPPSKQEAVPWELTLAQLVGIDGSLALAKLRMDIERELRRLSHEHGLDVQARPASLQLMTRELENQQVIPVEVGMLLRDVMTVTNQAIHGREVQNDQTRKVVDVGLQIIDFLRGIKSIDPTVVPSSGAQRRIRLDDDV